MRISQACLLLEKPRFHWSHWFCASTIFVVGAALIVPVAHAAHFAYVVLVANDAIVVRVALVAGTAVANHLRLAAVKDQRRLFLAIGDAEFVLERRSEVFRGEELSQAFLYTG